MAADDTILTELEQAQHDHTLMCVDVGIYTGFKKAVEVVEQLHDEIDCDLEGDTDKLRVVEDILRRLYAVQPKPPL